MAQCDKTRLVTLHAGFSLHECHADLLQLGAHFCTHVPIMAGYICVCDDPTADMVAKHQSVCTVEDDVDVTLVISPSQARPSARNVEMVPEGVGAIRAPSAWGISRGTGVGVAVLDTGIDLSHPDLIANVAGGINMINPSALPRDDHGHGTHVAGIIAAAHNAIGVVGVAPEARLYAVKVLDASGRGRLSQVLLGLQWAVNRRIPVVNMSLGTSVNVYAFEQAVQNAAAAGVTMVAAAGNGGKPGTVSYPARYSEVLAISALSLEGNLASFSSSGPEVDLAAPGVSILSTLPRRRYGRLSGTSMASPHVAGIAALYLARNPQASSLQVREALKASAVPLPGLTPTEQGAGRVDALNAVLAARTSGMAKSDPSPPREPAPQAHLPAVAAGNTLSTDSDVNLDAQTQGDTTPPD